MIRKFFAQEIPDNFYIAGARNISSNLSTVTWKWMEVKPTPLRLNKTYSQVRKGILSLNWGTEEDSKQGRVERSTPIPLF